MRPALLISDVSYSTKTARVLEAIAERPGLSNRGVAEHAGISDQGQISKLFWRV